MKLFIEKGYEQTTLQDIADSNIKKPEIMAELLSVIFNIWISPIIFMDSKEKFTAKLRYASEILDGVGLPIMHSNFLCLISMYFLMIQKVAMAYIYLIFR